MAAGDNDSRLLQQQMLGCCHCYLLRQLVTLSGHTYLLVDNQHQCVLNVSTEPHWTCYPVHSLKTQLSDTGPTVNLQMRQSGTMRYGQWPLC